MHTSWQMGKKWEVRADRKGSKGGEKKSTTNLFDAVYEAPQTNRERGKIDREPLKEIKKLVGGGGLMNGPRAL